MSAPFRVERLAKQRRDGFDSGAPELDRYLLKQAGQDERRRIAACYLLLENGADRVAGFYTLSASSVLLDDLPIAAAKRLPRYPSVPTARVGRLAIDQGFQGRGLGGALLVDAVQRACSAGLGVHALVVDARDATAAAFYAHHGFLPLTGTPRTLFLPLSDAVQKLAGQ
ncbi:GNAT family N-acetyltransferase [Pirellulimonas nuda]|uniref:GNAT family N-acetyltransferase n=1 Tax=Pirellulimonas nuda TaxID=2528009 RepID=UPI00119F404E|nr:GNAT family N-acetyltransferase [Pirellulimonas nuda]